MSLDFIGGWRGRLATGISQLLTFLVFSVIFCSAGKLISILRGLHWIYRSISGLCRSASPTALRELSAGSSSLRLTIQILSIIGTSGVVSYTVMTYVYNLVLMAFVGIAQGCQPLVSYAVGQQDSKTIKLVYRYGLTAVALTSVLCFGGCWIFTPQIVSVFIRPQETALFGRR